MTTPKNKYERPDDVVVEDAEEKKIVSSYTVEPALLFVVSEKGKYDIYVDTTGDKVEPNSEFMIHLGLDSESENEFEDNGDYVGLGLLSGNRAGLSRAVENNKDLVTNNENLEAGESGPETPKKLMKGPVSGTSSEPQAPFQDRGPQKELSHASNEDVY